MKKLQKLTKTIQFVDDPLFKFIYNKNKMHALYAKCKWTLN